MLKKSLSIGFKQKELKERLAAHRAVLFQNLCFRLATRFIADRPAQPPGDTRLRTYFDKATEAIEQWCRDAKLAA